MSREEEVTRILAVGLRQILEKSAIDFAGMEEIRLRVDQPFMVVCGGKKNFVSDTGEFCPGEEAHRVTLSEIGETVDYISSYSRYAFEEKIRQGFLTIQGGHRVGLCGRTVAEDGRVRTISPITFLNIRIARQIPGCGPSFVGEGAAVRYADFVSSGTGKDDASAGYYPAAVRWDRRAGLHGRSGG